MLNKLKKFFAGSESQNHAVIQNAESTPHPAMPPASREIERKRLKEKASGKVSLLKLCDQKLEKISKFFALEEDSPISRGTLESETSGAVLPDDVDDVQSSASIGKTSGVPENISLLQMCDRKLEELSNQSNNEGAATSMEEDFHSGNVVFESSAAVPKILNAAPELIATNQAVRDDIVATAAKPVRCPDLRMEEPLQLLEQLLEEHITKVNVAEQDLFAFKDELSQQIAAQAHVTEQQLLDNKITFEIMLKSTIRKITDRQLAMEEAFNQQAGSIIQVLEANRVNLATTIGKLEEIAEHLVQLTEYAQSLSNKIEKLQADFDSSAVALRENAAERTKKRKSWFK